MAMSFGRGTVYDLSGEVRIAEVYYYIQGTTPGGSTKETGGYIDPLLQYQEDFAKLINNSRMILETQDGCRLKIKLEQRETSATESLPLFFRTRVSMDNGDLSRNDDLLEDRQEVKSNNMLCKES